MPSDNAFIGKPDPPTDADLSLALGPLHPLWDQLVKELALDSEWNSYSRKAGWALRLKRGKRNIIYLSPLPNAFRASFVLGGKAIEAAYQSSLPEEILAIIRNGKRYPEGTGIVLDVTSADIFPAIHSLVQIKLAH